MRRSGFKSRQPSSRFGDPDRVRATPSVVPGAFRLGEPVSEQVVSVPKPEKLRNPAVLELARNEPCMLMIPGFCLGGVETVVQCHSNLGIHGKGGSTKAHDCCSFSGCHGCHVWLDQLKAPSYEQKHAATMAALARQIDRWATWQAPQYSAKHVRASLWALSNIHALAQANHCAFDECVHSALAGLNAYCISAITQ